MFRNKSVDVHKFSMIPKASIPRSKFRIQHAHKTTFDSGYLIPIYIDEVLPGDTFNVRMTAFARLATPIFPLMDNMRMDTFFFFVPNRLVWDNWQRFMGEQIDPGDTTSFVIPKSTFPDGGYSINTLQDYMGLPTIGQVDPSGQVTHSALFLRAYNLIWNEWFRDENLQDRVPFNKGDGPDPHTDYVLLKRGKRHDYFTSCLPWPQKGESVSIPLGTIAPVRPYVTGQDATGWPAVTMADPATGFGAPAGPIGVNAIAELVRSDGGLGTNQAAAVPNNLFADLSEATAATINQLRQSFQIQKLLERDARGGTRYTEILRAHFGVVSPDARLQRPEYLGGGSTPVSITPIAQTSGSAGAGGYTDTPQGNLAAFGTVLARGNGFTQSFVEHGMIIGLAMVRADLNYQQGLRKMWSRNTRYDFYFPAFAMLGEQAVLNKEIYCTGTASDEGVFGYQERWSEYRHNPSLITGYFRSTAAGTLDAWHLAQHFTALPTLNNTFITENVPVDRVVAVSAEANGKQFIFDSFFDITAARPLPMYSVPGLIDHF